MPLPSLLVPTMTRQKFPKSSYCLLHSQFSNRGPKSFPGAPLCFHFCLYVSLSIGCMSAEASAGGIPAMPNTPPPLKNDIVLGSSLWQTAASFIWTIPFEEVSLSIQQTESASCHYSLPHAFLPAIQAFLGWTQTQMVLEDR